VRCRNTRVKGIDDISFSCSPLFIIFKTLRMLDTTRFSYVLINMPFALIFTSSHTQTVPITLAGMTGGHQIPWGEGVRLVLTTDREHAVRRGSGGILRRHRGVAA
jgi:hypothetical protein